MFGVRPNQEIKSYIDKQVNGKVYLTHQYYFFQTFERRRSNKLEQPPRSEFYEYPVYVP